MQSHVYQTKAPSNQQSAWVAKLNESKTPNKSKQVEVGRTRLIWSNLVEGCAPSTSSMQDRIIYTSLITGRRLDPTTILRPREIKVGVRLKGNLIQEEATEDVPEATASSSKKRKQSTSINSAIILRERRYREKTVYSSLSRTHFDFTFTLDGANPSQDKMLLNTSRQNSVKLILFPRLNSCTKHQRKQWLDYL